MSFDIEKMKRDGVSQRIIDFVSLSLDELILKIGRRIENDSLFRQFMGVSSNMEAVLPYAVAARLITEAERKWLIDPENPYGYEGDESTDDVWINTPNVTSNCVEISLDSDYVSKNANFADLIANPNDYDVFVTISGQRTQWTYEDNVTEENLDGWWSDECDRLCIQNSTVYISGECKDGTVKECTERSPYTLIVEVIHK